MAHTDNIAEVVTGRFANTGDVGGHQGYTHRRKLRSLMQTARQRKQVGSLKQICEKCVHREESEQDEQKSRRHQHRAVTDCTQCMAPSSDMLAE